VQLLCNCFILVVATALAWSAAEHVPDHLRCLCSLPAVDARRHPGRRGAFDVYWCRTCSLYGGMWIEMPASFVVTFCRRGPCFSRRVRLLLIVIAAGVSVSTETRKPIYRIHQYCKATSEYSLIHSIGLTRINTCRCTDEETHRAYCLNATTASVYLTPLIWLPPPPSLLGRPNYVSRSTIVYIASSVDGWSAYCLWSANRRLA